MKVLLTFAAAMRPAPVYTVIYATLLFALTLTTARAQADINGDFEDLNCTCTSCPAFQDGCANGPWYVSHGTPDILEASGNHYAHMGAIRQSGSTWLFEGLFLECEFEAGVEYSLSIKFKLAPFNDRIPEIKILLANNLVHVPLPVPNPDGFAVPTGITSEEIAVIEDFGDFDWQQFDYVFTPSESGFRQLWIYPWVPVAHPFPVFSQIDMDDVVIEATCLASRTFIDATDPNGNPALPIQTRVLNNIELLGVNVVAADEAATFQAELGQIRFATGFEARGASFVHARIAPCDYLNCTESANKSALPIDIDAEKNDPVRQEAKAQLRLFPNPAAHQTLLEYDPGRAGPVTLKLIDLYGRTLAVLLDGEAHKPGRYQVYHGTSHLPEGWYLYTLRTAKASTAVRLLIVK